MNKMIVGILVAAASAVSFADDASEASFATPFTHHAVLQRDCALPVWGFATPGSTVNVKLDNTTLQAVADGKGRWKVEFPAMKAGLGHTLTLSSGQRVFADLDDIAVGDVWICSGQSNMAMNWHGGLTRGREEMEKNRYWNLRVFGMMEAFSLDPVEKYGRPAEWQHANIDTVRGFSACGYFFGVELLNRLKDVPIGLVNASWGGSAASVWMSLEAYASADDYCAQAAKDHLDRIAKYKAGGGAEGYAKRVEKWKRDCNEKGSIPAERPDFGDAEWESVKMPSLLPGDFDGCAWYRRSVTLTAEQAKGAATLALGPIDDADVTYVNGVKVGGSDQWSLPREYAVPEGTLRAGANVIAVRVRDNGGAGGLIEGDASKLQLRTSAGAVALAGDWKVRYFPFDAQPFDAGQIQYWTPAACYNAMLNPLFPMAAKGAIWYQGCSDVGAAERYDHQIRALVKDWRSHFTHSGAFPFYIVQLAAFQQTHDQPVESEWAKMRWTQMKLGETMDDSGTVVIVDAGDHNDIHPKDKKTPGERLARLALARTYGERGLVEAGPIPLRAKALKDKVGVAFKNSVGLKTSDGGKVRGFQLAGADGKFSLAEAQIVKDKVVLAVPEGMKPAKVRYAWDDYPDCNLANAEGLPCGSFELVVE